jgi:drug/metabolite transporter (DMT)-like permease
VNVSRTARHFGCSRTTVYRWLAPFDRARLETLEDRSSAPRRRRRRPTWTVAQVDAVHELRERYPRWGTDKHVVLLRRSGWSCRPRWSAGSSATSPGAVSCASRPGAGSASANGSGVGRTPSVMLWALEPLLILVLAAWLLRERVMPELVLLSLIAVGGMLLVIYQPGGVGSPIGVLLTAAGVGCCAVYTAITRRWLSTADSTGQVVVAQQAYALAFAFLLVTVARILGGAGLPVAVSPTGLVSAIGSGVLYCGLAYWLYLTGLRRAPASIAAASFYLIPIFGVSGGFLLLGERLEPIQWVGVAVVLTAAAVILGKTSAQPVESIPAVRTA